MLSGALIGAGNIARNGHLPAYLAGPGLADRLRIESVADLCEENLAEVRALIPQVRTYASPEALFRAEAPDFVDICTPPYAHRGIIEQALAAGCHVLCEKPVATCRDEALAIRDLALASGRVFFPCHQYRYAPQWQALAEAVRSEAVGALHSGVVTVLRTGANAGNSGWHPAWRTDERLAGGGILVDHGTHLFYQLHGLFGPPTQLACRTERRLPGYCVDDTVAIVLGYDWGMIRLWLTWAAGQRYSGQQFFGSKGTISCLDDEVRIDAGRASRRIAFETGLSSGSAHAEWFVPLLDDFARRIEQRDSSCDLLDEAVIVASYIDGAYASAARGTPVEWRDPIEDTRIQFAAAD